MSRRRPHFKIKGEGKATRVLYVPRRGDPIPIECVKRVELDITAGGVTSCVIHCGEPNIDVQVDIAAAHLADDA